MDADEVIARYRLEPHPEGGHYRETFRASAANGGRGSVSAIYYLLKAGETSAWHRIDAVEIWHHYAGAPLRLSLCSDGTTVSERLLGSSDGAAPQAVVPVGCWQSAVSLGEWTLVGCTVAPAFEFSGFELASPEWRPGMPSA
ncbi:MAG: cupin domain-containing protein [Boseongicola sp. SB0677_bin_26]|nr:cupin domain-containing protein [Boseongicola sp. SB0665_bin_10]MYG26903.1 cupin domain-containing protein [Boseongicola sp. SB0677_bin_26]